MGDFQAEDVTTEKAEADGLAFVEEAGVVKAQLGAAFAIAEGVSVDDDGFAITEATPMGQRVELGDDALGDLALGLAQGGLQAQKFGIAGAQGYEGNQAEQSAANH